MNNKRNAIIVLVVVLVAGLVYYRDALVKYLNISGSLAPGSGYESTRELSEDSTYAVPNGEDKTKFSVFVDKAGVVTDVKATDLIKDNTEVQGHLNTFAETLLTVIKGKKLSEIEKVDKVGTASLTTNAFNSALANLKSQL